MTSIDCGKPSRHPEPMPYKSDQQRKYFHAAEARGEIPEATVKEFDKASKGMKLPKKAKAKKTAKDPDEARKDSMIGMFKAKGAKIPC